MASGIVETSSQESASQPQQQGAGRSKLVQRLLAASGNLPQFLNDLLSTMATVVVGTEAAGFLIERANVPADTAAGAGGDDGVADGPAVSAPGGDGDDEMAALPPGQQVPAKQPGFLLRPVAHLRPDDSDAATRAAAIKAFQEIIAPCVQQGKDGAIEVGAPDAGEPQYCLVTLLRNEGQVVAAAAVITRARDVERARQRLVSMQLVAGYFELFSMRRGVEQTRLIAQNHQNVLQLTTAVGTAEGFEAAAMNLCNELAQRTGASRVSLGWLKGKNMKVRALSHTEKFDKKQELIVGIEKAMEECLDQEEPVRFDFDGQRSENVSRSHEALSRSQGTESVLSLPLRRKDEVLGVLTLEFAPPVKLPEQIVDALVVATDVLTPQLRDRYDNDRWLPVKVGHSIVRVSGMAVGPKHMLAKLVIVLVFAAAAFVTFFKPMYHVSAPFMFAAEGKQPVSIPFEGKIESIGKSAVTGKMLQPGDVVKRGDVLAVMDTRQLQEQLYQAQSKGAAARARADAARVQNQPGKVAEMNEARKEAEAADAEARFYRLQIEDGTMRAAFDGVIIRADNLDEKAGFAVKKGDVLMEVAQKGRLRAELAVSERDIQEIRENGVQHGKLATSSFPSDDIKFTIDRIVPNSEAKEGDNVFKVFATLDEEREWMRPGMAGEARVDVEHRRLVWIWTHRLIDFLKLKLWM